jgi:hypothetical protein
VNSNNLPGFTAEKSIDRTSEHSRLAAVWIDHNIEQAVFPATKTYTKTECTYPTIETECNLDAQGIQHCFPVPSCAVYSQCIHYDGDCTGTKLFFWQTPPTRCVTSASGKSQCITAWSQYPWIMECDDGTSSQGSGFCLW